MKILINHSNHPVEKWSEEQKAGWDKIVDLPFPAIDPHADMEEIEKIALENFKKIREIAVREGADKNSIYVMLQGEFSYCYTLFHSIRNLFLIAIPTTERVVEEKPDGSKVSVFKFVRWRFL